MVDIKLPDKWDEWKITEKQGEGAFGAVYKAEREFNGKKFYSAIKIIRIPSSGMEMDELELKNATLEEQKEYYKDLVIEYETEIELMISLRGITNIVSVEDYHIEELTEEVGWIIYIRMEFLQSLAAYVGTHRLTEKDIIQIGIDICSGLEQCERIRILHRDIKMDNILVSPLGHFKLADFGVSKQWEETLATHTKKGTIAYMAPEVYHGKRYSMQADLYSLGMVLYRLMNRNREPFVNLEKQMVYYKDKAQALEKRMNGVEIPLPINASEAFGLVICKACSYNPADRYKNATEFRKTLEMLLEEPQKVEEQPIRKVVVDTPTIINHEITEEIMKYDREAKEVTTQFLPPKAKKKSKLPVILGICGALCFMTAIAGWLTAGRLQRDVVSKEDVQETSATKESAQIAPIHLSVSEFAGFEISDNGVVKRWVNQNKIKAALQENEAISEDVSNKVAANLINQLVFEQDVKQLTTGDKLVMEFQPDEEYQELLNEANIELEFEKKEKEFQKNS